MSVTIDHLEDLDPLIERVTIDVPTESPVNQCNLAITFVKFKNLRCDKCDTTFEVGATPNWTLRCAEHDYDECASCVTSSSPDSTHNNKPIHEHQLMFIACAKDQLCDGPCNKTIKHGHYASVCSVCKVYFCRPCLHASVHSVHRMSSIVAPPPESVKAYVFGENDIRPVCKVYFCRPCLHASVHSVHRMSSIVAPPPESVKAYVFGENDIRPVPTVVFDKDGVAFEIRHEL